MSFKYINLYTFISDQVLITSTPAVTKNRPARKQRLDFSATSELEQPSSHMPKQPSSHIPDNSALDSTFRLLSINEDIGGKDGDPFDSETESNASSKSEDNDSDASVGNTSDTEGEHTSEDDTSASSSRYA